MDPRHPELAIARIDELMAQYKRIIGDMQTCNVSSKLAQLEREEGLVVQEICLIAPRLHDAMIQVSRTRRAALTHGIVIDMSKDEISAELLKEPTLEGVENYVEKAKEDYVAPNQAETVIVEPKPRKKKTTKKKKAE